MTGSTSSASRLAARARRKPPSRRTSVRLDPAPGCPAGAAPHGPAARGPVAAHAPEAMMLGSSPRLCGEGLSEPPENGQLLVDQVERYRCVSAGDPAPRDRDAQVLARFFSTAGCDA